MIHALQRQTPGTYMTPTKHFSHHIRLPGADEVLDKDTKLLLDWPFFHNVILLLTTSLDDPTSRHFYQLLLILINLNCLVCVYCFEAHILLNKLKAFCNL